MAVNLSPIWGAGAQLLDNSGNVLTGGKIYTYLAGTTTPATTYTSSNGNTANSNPIILNSAGRVPYEIWLTDSIEYKFVLKDSNDTLIGTWDNLIGINSNFINYYGQQEIQTATAGQTVFNLTDFEYVPGTGNLSVFVDGVNQYGPGAQYAYVETDSNTVTFVSGLHVGASVKFTTTKLENVGVADASQISYTYPDSNAVTQNVEERLAQYINVKDFGAVGDGVTDDTDAIQNAIDAAEIGSTVNLGNARYYIASDLTIKEGVTVKGASSDVWGTALYDAAWFDSLTSVFFVDPSATIYMKNGSCLYGVNVFNSDIQEPQQNVSNFGGTAITVGYDSLNTVDVTIEECLIVGFNKAIDAKDTPRLTIAYTMFDAINGISSNGSGDPTFVDRCHGWPFATVNYLFNGGPVSCITRNGTAYYFTGNQDATKVTNSYAVDYLNTWLVDGANGIVFDTCGADAPDIANSVGFQLQGNFGVIQLNNCQAVACSSGFTINASANTGMVLANNIYFASNTLADIVIDQGSINLTGSYLNSNVTNSIINVSSNANINVTGCTIGNAKSGGAFLLNTGNTPNYYIDNSNKFVNQNIALVSATSWTIPTIASANTITLPTNGQLFDITGTTGMFGLTNMIPGRLVTFRFNGTLTVSSTSSFVLNGNFNAVSGSTLTVIGLSDVSAIEVARKT